MKHMACMQACFSQQGAKIPEVPLLMPLRSLVEASICPRPLCMMQ